MTKPRRPSAPSDLEKRGRAFWRKVLDQIDLDIDGLELLAETARTLDTCDKLRERIDADGVMVKGSTGQARLHPAVVELRQQRVALAKFLDLLGIETPDGIPEVGVRDFHVVATDQAGQGSQANPGARASRASQASRRGQKAATARWDRQRAQDERRRAAHGAPRT